jgi:hypothetical protein
MGFIKITDIYHGKISLTDKPDEGTTYKVAFPEYLFTFL